MIGWLGRRRRARLLRQPFPPLWIGILQRNVRHYAALNDDEQTRLRDDIRILIAEKYWEAAAGLELTDEVKVTIAAQAALLVLGMTHDSFRRVRTIIVYPGSFTTPHGHRDSAGVVSEGFINRGEAWFRGPVIISWPDALAGGRGQTFGRNLVLHEFTHALDMMDGLVDGTPPLRGRDQYRRWHRVMTEAYERLIEQSQRGIPTLIDEYGATNVAEFFAVATECFFEQGQRLRQEQPELYDVLRGFYHQDPAGRVLD